MKEFLKLKADLPGFSLELSTGKPLKALSELRRLLEKIPGSEDAIYEEFAVQEMRQNLSESFVKNQEIMKAVKDLLKKNENYVASASNITSTATIDLDNRTKTTKIDKNDVKRAVSSIMSDIDPKDVKQGIIHVSGTLDRQDKLLILDHIHKSMPTAQLRAFNSDAQTVRVECVFFGDFEDDE